MTIEFVKQISEGARMDSKTSFKRILAEKIGVALAEKTKEVASLICESESFRVSYSYTDYVSAGKKQKGKPGKIEKKEFTGNFVVKSKNERTAKMMALKQLNKSGLKSNIRITRVMSESVGADEESLICESESFKLFYSYWDYAPDTSGKGKGVVSSSERRTHKGSFKISAKNAQDAKTTGLKQLQKNKNGRQDLKITRVVSV